MLIIAQCCQVLLCWTSSINSTELIQTFILHKIKYCSLPSATHDCFALPVITHYCLQFQMLWGPVPLNQIKQEQIELNWIKLNRKKYWKWKRHGLNFAQFYPELFCVISYCSMLLTTAMPVDFLVIWKSIQWNLIEMGCWWNWKKLCETLNSHLSHCYPWLTSDAHNCSALSTFTVWTSSI